MVNGRSPDQWLGEHGGKSDCHFNYSVYKQVEADGLKGIKIKYIQNLYFVGYFDAAILKTCKVKVHTLSIFEGYSEGGGLSSYSGISKTLKDSIYALDVQTIRYCKEQD